jgi:hypothetical protein
MHRTTPGFWQCFEDLSESVQEIAEKNFALLRSNHLHPSLHFKKVGKFWSARVGSNYRALAIEDGQDYTWVWIGAHDEYKRIIKDYS